MAAHMAAGVRRVKPSAWVELALALPWLWWSWLAIALISGPFDTFGVVLSVVWLVSAFAVVVYPPLEHVLAAKVYRLRKPFEWELRRLGPAWWAVCTAAGADPNRYRLWIHEGPEATPPYPAPGAAIAVTNWALSRLPDRHLEAVLAHELAHSLALPRIPSLLLYWLTLPAKIAGRIVDFCWNHRLLKTLLKVVVGFFLISVIGIGLFLGFDSVWVWLLLSPFAAPVVVPWVARVQEKMADRVAFDLGYGFLLAQVFQGREYERAQLAEQGLRQTVGGTQPLDSARLHALEDLLNSSPQNGHHPPY
ncbi:M48 family metalloprotease [Kribbella sp. NPDC056951]|uniref:M48 family metalloprotease n=1 Tax=Kribbella sp. NPDC056951 TaxID=3345978 RepID=UPI003643A148